MHPTTDRATQKQTARPTAWDEALADRYLIRRGEVEVTDQREELPPRLGAVPRAAWNPADGASAAPQQRVPAPVELLADGSVPDGLWAPSEGPCRVDPGGAGGEPNGRSVPIRKVVWD